MPETDQPNDRPICPKCGRSLQKNGRRNGGQRWRCVCGYSLERIKQEKPGMPKKYENDKERWAAAYLRRKLRKE